MSKATPTKDGNKSWAAINQERKALKRKRKQENLLKQMSQHQALKELAADTSSDAEDEQQKGQGQRKTPSTISIAVPGSILENAQSAELRAYLAGQIARAACIFRVDEVIVFDDINDGINNVKKSKTVEDGDGVSGTVRSSCLQLARILQYLECPQYLRKFFFPLHNDLKYCGLLNPLDAPHHLRQQNTFPYREGIVTERKVKDDNGSYVNVGLLNDVLADKPLLSGVRVTVKLKSLNDKSSKKMKGKVVSPAEPRQKTGVYWGYSVRIASSLSQVFTKSPYESGYDLTIGTSDKGTSVHEIESSSLKYNHALIVFGGLRGLEEVLENDEKLTVDDPKFLFDQYLNVIPSQGSRTVRTEEAILISMAALQEKLNPEVKDKTFDLQGCLPQSEDTGRRQVPV